VGPLAPTAPVGPVTTLVSSASRTPFTVKKLLAPAVPVAPWVPCPPLALIVIAGHVPERVTLLPAIKAGVAVPLPPAATGTGVLRVRLWALRAPFTETAPVPAICIRTVEFVAKTIGATVSPSPLL